MPTTKSAPDPALLTNRLAGLRRRVRFVAAFRGLSLLFALVPAMLIAACLLDWRWHLPELIRAFALVAALTTTGLILFRNLLRPLAEPVDDLSLALRIEEVFPGLNDSLASAVQFSEPTERDNGDSPAMRRETVNQALRRSASCDFKRIVDRRGLGWLAFAMGIACAAGGFLIWLDPAQAATALTRLGDPFGNHAWPRRTRIELEPARTRIGRNETFEVRARLHGVIPEKSTVVFRFENQSALEHHECDVTKEGPAAGRMLTRLDAGRVQRTFHFKVKANDAETEEYEIQVSPPPVLAPIDGKPSPQVRLWPPRYTDLASPLDLPPGSGNIEAPVGTAVMFRATADRPLSRAWIEYQPDNRFLPLSAFLSPLGATNGIGVAGFGACGHAVWGSVPAVLDSEGKTFSIAFHPRVSGLYVLHFEDETGLSNQRVFELRLRPDPAPTVQLVRPAPSRDVLALLPSAELTLHVGVEDPFYAIRSVFFEYRTHREDIARQRLFYSPEKMAGAVFGPLMGASALVVPWKLRPVQLEFRQSLSLKILTHADGSPLREGDLLILQAAADDFDDVTVNKQLGRSHEVEVRIVGRNAIELILNQKQAEVQQELLRLREKQREALAQVTAAEGQLKRAGKLTQEERNKILEAEQIQHQIRDRVGDAKEGLRAEVGRIVDVVRQNDLRDSAAKERMSDVDRELDRLANEELDPIEPRLASARKQAEWLEEAVRAERKTQMEEQARETERRNRVAEQMSKARVEEAAQADGRGNQTSDPATKAREQTDARRLRQEAEELRQRARALALQAARERREAAVAPRKEQPVEELADARRHQEEVERTLNDLLTRLEPWSSSREIKGEAGRILQEQKNLQQNVEDLQNEGFPREDPARLTDPQKSELEERKNAQQRLEERTRQLLAKMGRLAAERKVKDPDTAEELQAAFEKGTQAGIADQMKTAREQIQANRLSEAGRAQQKSIDELSKLVKSLEDRREAELDKLAKKLRQAEDRLSEMVREQDELRKKIEDAGKIADAKERQEELKKLALRQEKLQEDAKEMVKQLSRLRAGEAGKALAQADSEMARARQRMREGAAPAEDDETLDHLEDAQREVRKARAEAEESLTREQMERVAEALLRLRDRQSALITEAGRIQAEVLRRAKAGDTKAAQVRWPRDLLLGSWNRLREAQVGLAQEAEPLAEKELMGTPVFRRLLKKAAEAMTDAVKRMESVGKKPAPPDSLPDVESHRLQQLAMRRLEQLASALKEENDGTRTAGKGSGDGDSEGGGAQGSGLPPLGQLKLLRAMQMEINERTEAFRAKHAGSEKLPEKDKAELQVLRRDQREVAELLDELMRAPGEPAEREGDKK